jgi:subtilisin family serine protease
MTLPQGVLARALQTRIEELAGRDLAPIKIAVLDTGVDGSHPDLKGRVIRGVICTAGQDGKVDIQESDPTANNDMQGHGTGVASIIARIAPNVSIIDVRVLGVGAVGTADAFIAGCDHAVDSEAQVLNMSLALAMKFVPRLTPLCDAAYRKGTIIVASRRNSPLGDDEGYPASLIPCIGVDNAGRGPAPVWSYQTEVIEYTAHGEDVATAAAGGGYTTMSGASFATPIVAGFVCLLLGAYPGLRPFEVKAILKALAAGEAAA